MAASSGPSTSACTTCCAGSVQAATPRQAAVKGSDESMSLTLKWRAATTLPVDGSLLRPECFLEQAAGAGLADEGAAGQHHGRARRAVRGSRGAGRRASDSRGEPRACARACARHVAGRADRSWECRSRARCRDGGRVHRCRGLGRRLGRSRDARRVHEDPGQCGGIPGGGVSGKPAGNARGRHPGRGLGRR